MDQAGVTLRARTLLLGVLVAALVGAGIRGLLHDAPTPRTQTPASETRHPEQSTRDGVSAVRAAARFVRAGQRILELAPVDRDAALGAMAAPDANGWVADQRRVFAELDGIAARGEGPLTWDVAVLATRLDAHTRTRARVQVWRLGVLSIRGLTAPIAEYTTVAYELVWVTGSGWRIWSETQQPGPSPMPHPEAIPATPAELATRLAGFARYPGPEPVIDQ